MGMIPVLVDVATEPYARRGLARSWLYGAGKLAASAGISWAAAAVCKRAELEQAESYWKGD